MLIKIEKSEEPQLGYGNLVRFFISPENILFEANRGNVFFFLKNNLNPVEIPRYKQNETLDYANPCAVGTQGGPDSAAFKS